MDYLKGKSYLVNQIFVLSGILSTLLSCGLALGYAAVTLHERDPDNINATSFEDPTVQCIETAGEIAFVPSIVVIPFFMQKIGRKMASIVTAVPLVFSWLISFDNHHKTSLIIFNVLHHISLGGALTTCSVIVSEYCTPKYRGTFLMLETTMISLGVLISHICAMFSIWKTLSVFGIITGLYSLISSYFWPESPHWLISRGFMVKSTESFQMLRGHDEDAYKELEAMMKTQRLKLQLDALRPIVKRNLKEKYLSYAKSLLKADFLRPLSIMILLFSFISFGSENVVSSYSLRNIFKFTNGKYIGTIVLDVLTLVCSLTACVLIQIVKRKALFIFTGSFSVIFLAFTSLILFLQYIESFSTDYTWLFLSFVTGSVMFMSLGTAALPLSLLGEIFPMSYKGIGSTLTCAYLWAFSNSLLTLLPTLATYIGVHGVLFLSIIFMIIILLLLSKIMPETNAKTLLEIEELLKDKKKNINNDYQSVDINDGDEVNNFDRLKLFIDV